MNDGKGLDFNKNQIDAGGRFISYVWGFILSTVLTFSAYFLVQLHVATLHGIPSDTVAIAILLFLAVVQLVVQLLFFLHLGREAKPRWNLLFLIATVGLVLIIVLGSVWIMNNLNYKMTPTEINNYLQDQSTF